MKFKRHKTVDGLLADLYSGDEEMIEAVNTMYNEDLMANHLFILRTKAGVSQAEMAKRLDVSQSVISKMENNGNYLKFNDVIRYINALGYSAELAFIEGGRSVDFLGSYFGRIKKTMDELQALAGDDPDITKGIMAAFLTFSKSLLEEMIPRLKGRLPKREAPLRISINSQNREPEALTHAKRRKKNRQPARAN